MAIKDFEYYDARFLICELLCRINKILDWFGWGFCLHCFKFTFNLHDDSDYSYHCRDCCLILYEGEEL